MPVQAQFHVFDRAEEGAVLADDLRGSCDAPLVEFVMVLTKTALAGQDVQHILHAGVKLRRPQRHIDLLQDVAVAASVLRKYIINSLTLIKHWATVNARGCLRLHHNALLAQHKFVHIAIIGDVNALELVDGVGKRSHAKRVVFVRV